MNKEKQEIGRYNNLDGIRAIAAIGIVMMHVRGNLGIKIDGYLYNTVIYQLGYLAFLFMCISAFSMCCGYYEKIMENKISVVDFYKKRYMRILPFFLILVLLDVIYGFSIDTLMEGIASLTLCFSLLPNSTMSVIGVAWTLGVIFVFYLLFPFFCFLVSTKKRAIAITFIALLMHVMCRCYFFDSNHVVESFNRDSNIMFCGIYFMIGGLIFKYRTEIFDFVKRYAAVCTVGMIGLTIVLFVFVEDFSIKTIGIFSLWMCYSIGPERKILSNKIMKSISNISMEIYLSHMVVFKIVNKGIHNLNINGIIRYILCVVIVVAGAAGVSVVLKKCIRRVGDLLRNTKRFA